MNVQFDKVAIDLGEQLVDHPNLLADDKKLKNTIGDFVQDSDLRSALKLLVELGYVQKLLQTDDKWKLVKIAEDNQKKLVKKSAIDEETAHIAVNFWYKAVKIERQDILSKKQPTKATVVQPSVKQIKQQKDVDELILVGDYPTPEELRERKRIKIMWVIALIAVLIILVKLTGNGNSSKSANSSYRSSNSTVQKSKSEAYSYSASGVEEMFGNYCNGLVEAINSGSFSKVENTLDANYSLYEQQKNLVQRLYGKGTTEEFITGNIESKYDSAKDVIVADVYEKHLVKYSSGKTRYADEFSVYTLAPYKPYKLRTIAKGNDPYGNGSPATCNSDGAHIYTKPDFNAAFGQMRRNDALKVFNSRTKHASGNNWIWVKHPYFGYGWMRSVRVSQ